MKIEKAKTVQQEQIDNMIAKLKEDDSIEIEDEEQKSVISRIPSLKHIKGKSNFIRNFVIKIEAEKEEQ